MNATTAPIAIVEADAAAIDSVMTVMGQAFDSSFGEAWKREQCLGILGLPGVWLSLAIRDDQVEGFALSRIVVDEAELLLIAVSPQTQGRGTGTLLIDETVREAKARGAMRLHLEVRDGNPALSLYQRFNFIPVGRRRDYYLGRSGQSFDALTLTRILEDI